MNIREATRNYEAWLARQTKLSPQDLAVKHQRMADELFAFLRATYYRWAQLIAGNCPELTKDFAVLAVADLHLENFGTWRDADGRLVWGINDFDECHKLPFSHDLTRLAASAEIAIDSGQLALAHADAAAGILKGYQACLKTGGRPVVLADDDTPLRQMARDRLNNPGLFWQRMNSHPPLKSPPPPAVRRLIVDALPEPKIPLHFVKRTAGLGSLGKQRFTAIGDWQGGKIIREAKALTPSACWWAQGSAAKAGIQYDQILQVAVRCRDPWVRVCGNWLLRRLSPDCFRIELANLPKVRDESALLFAMGWETANIHLGTSSPAKLSAALAKKKSHWLRNAAKAMRDATVADWKDWRKS